MIRSLKKTAFATALTVMATLSSSALAGGEGWSHDYEASKAKAKTEKKDLLLDFTGSDWCGWCIKLNKEVFSKDRFKSEMPNEFVLVELDYPRNKSKLSKETIAQNNKLKAQFKIQGYPTIYLADHMGRPYAKTGYQKGGPEKYNAHLMELKQKRVTRDSKLAAAQKAEGLAKAKLLDEAIQAVGDELAWAYPKVIDQILTLDKDNKAGLKAKYMLKKDLDSLTALIGKRQYKEAEAMVKTLLGQYAENPAALQDIYFKQGEIAFRTQKSPLPSLKAALAADPNSKKAPMFKAMIARFERMEAQKKK